MSVKLREQKSSAESAAQQSPGRKPWELMELAVSPARAKPPVSPLQGFVLFVLPPGLRLLRSLALGCAVPRFQRSIFLSLTRMPGRAKDKAVKDFRPSRAPYYANSYRGFATLTPGFLSATPAGAANRFFSGP
jgi:hypothetical protein